MKSFAKAGWKLWSSGTGCSLLTVIDLTKVITVLLKSCNKLTMENWTFFTFSRDATKKMNVLAAREASLKQGGSCGVCQQAAASSPSSALQRSPLSTGKGTVLKLTSVQFVNGLRWSNKWPVCQCVLRVCVCVCMANLTGVDCNSDEF